jgi:hypothetical protein
MATTFSAIGEAGTRSNGHYLGVAPLIIATDQLMPVLDGVVSADCAHDGCAAGDS